MTPEQKQRAFTLISAALAKDKDCIFIMTEETEPWFINQHPFDGGNDRFHQFIGEGTDDTITFIRKVLTSSSFVKTEDVKIEVIFWLMPTEEGGDQNIIWAEVRNDFQMWLTGGMTDFSGSGGAAYRDMQLAMAFLADLYGIEVQTRKVSYTQGLHAQHIVQQSIQQQLAEQREEAAREDY